MRPAELKQRIKEGKPVFGFMLFGIQGLRWGRLFAGSTLDYMVIDWEHASRDRTGLADLIGLVQASGITAIVRTPSTDPVFVAMAMDAGADGVLVPYCETVEEVKACAGKLRYHPLKGEYFHRAINTGEFPSPKSEEYLKNRHKDHIFIMGVESEPAVNRIDDLLECAEIDGIFIGPNDMTTSLGIPDEVDSPRYVDVLKRVIEAGERHGVPTMIHQQAMEPSTRAIELGVRFVLHSSDVGILLRGVQNEFAALREVAERRFGGVDEVAAEDTLDTI